MASTYSNQFFVCAHYFVYEFAQYMNRIKQCGSYSYINHSNFFCEYLLIIKHDMIELCSHPYCIFTPWSNFATSIPNHVREVFSRAFLEENSWDFHPSWNFPNCLLKELFTSSKGCLPMGSLQQFHTWWNSIWFLRGMLLRCLV